MKDFIEKMNYYFLHDGVKLARGVTIVLLGYIIIKIVIKILKKSVFHLKPSERTLSNFFISLINIVLMACLVVFALTLVGVSADAVVTIASVFSLGVSLALEGTISSLANGIIIVVTKPFVEGEFVSLNGVDGTVVSISMFNTTLKTADGLMITIPNSSAINSSVKNYSRYPTRRVDIEVPVSYETSTEQLKQVVLDVVKEQKGILSNPSPAIRMNEYGDSNLIFVLKVWVSNDIYWDTKFDLTEKIFDALNKANISIDYNRYEISMRENKNFKKGEK